MKSYVFYDDTADYEAYDDVRAYLFDLHGEDNGWETADEVPDNWVYDEISEQNNADWRELLHDLGRVFKEDCYLLTGTCGRWCGPAQGGKFINSTDDLLGYPLFRGRQHPRNTLQRGRDGVQAGEAYTKGHAETVYNGRSSRCSCSQASAQGWANVHV